MPTEEIQDTLSSAVDQDVEASAGTESGDSGDGVTVETDIKKSTETAVAETNEVANTVDETEFAIEPVVDTDFSADETEAEKQLGNAPIFIDPCHGGQNPFDDNRPGEGIHF